MGLKRTEFPRLGRIFSQIMETEHDADIDSGARADIPQCASEFDDPEARLRRFCLDREQSVPPMLGWGSTPSYGVRMQIGRSES
jgi:hypothetical protein